MLYESVTSMAALGIVALLCVIFIRILGFQNQGLEKITVWLIGIISIFFWLA